MIQKRLNHNKPKPVIYKPVFVVPKLMQNNPRNHTLTPVNNKISFPSNNTTISPSIIAPVAVSTAIIASSAAVPTLVAPTTQPTTAPSTTISAEPPKITATNSTTILPMTSVPNTFGNSFAIQSIKNQSNNKQKPIKREYLIGGAILLGIIVLIARRR